MFGGRTQGFGGDSARVIGVGGGSFPTIAALPANYQLTASHVSARQTALYPYRDLPILCLHRHAPVGIPRRSATTQGPLASTATHTSPAARSDTPATQDHRLDTWRALSRRA